MARETSVEKPNKKLAVEPETPAVEPETPAVEILKKVRVRAVNYPFVDLIKDMTIGFDPVEVEMHPWLQLQVDAGHLTIVE